MLCLFHHISSICAKLFPEASLVPSQTYMIELFCEISQRLKLLAISAKIYLIDLLQGPKHVSGFWKLKIRQVKKKTPTTSRNMLHMCQNAYLRWLVKTLTFQIEKNTLHLPKFLQLRTLSLKET